MLPDPISTSYTACPDSVTQQADLGRVYHVLADLLHHCASVPCLQEARAVLGTSKQSRAVLELRAAVSWALQHPESVVHSPLLARVAGSRCLAPDAPVRAWACVTADLVPTPLATTDLYTLAILADRAASAAKLGRSDLALTICELRAKLLQEHSASCLLQFADILQETDHPFHTRVGVALAAHLAEDLRLSQVTAEGTLGDSSRGPGVAASFEQVVRGDGHAA